ncbi:hypothetical protein [Microvirga arsenatis]|uniref:Uncharacterized protein n=1 Tax=Microvirga arsenatis TaxID=2692265 RepID=A0ABW9YXL7_9HYPH|nr:hypothetical protein [Microvirga arsenatis]NBJ13240.1 hypothetical protein [Microvirga arsenatis]NBJ25122.1 hypothetical protein [Microvirga arsenatis]
MTFEELMSDLRQQLQLPGPITISRDDARVIIESFEELTSTPTPSQGEHAELVERYFTSLDATSGYCTVQMVKDDEGDWVRYEDYASLTERVKELEGAEASDLVRANIDLLERSRQLECQNATLRSEYERLQQRVKELEALNDRACDLNDALFQENTNLKVDISTLRSENETLKRENERVNKFAADNFANSFDWQGMVEIANARALAAEARLEAMQKALEEFCDAARYDATMEGPKFKGGDLSRLNRARELAHAALTGAGHE